MYVPILLFYHPHFFFVTVLLFLLRNATPTSFYWFPSFLFLLPISSSLQVSKKVSPNLNNTPLLSSSLIRPPTADPTRVHLRSDEAIAHSVSTYFKHINLKSSYFGFFELIFLFWFLDLKSIFLVIPFYNKRLFNFLILFLKCWFEITNRDIISIWLW